MAIKRYNLLNIIAITVMFTLVFAGCQPIAEQQSPDELSVDPHPSEIADDVVLYFAGPEGMYVLQEVRSIVRRENAPLPDLIIGELIKGPTDKAHSRTIPEGTKLLAVDNEKSKINVREGVAYVNFSKELRTKHPGGSAGETMTTASIVNSLTELPGIEKVQILVEGKVEESIWGHGMTNEPLGRMESIIGPPEEPITSFSANNNLVQITLYFNNPNEQNNLAPEKRTILLREDLQLADLVIQELVVGPFSKDLTSLIPKDTLLLAADDDNSLVKIADGVAYVNLPQEIVTVLPLGDKRDKMIIDSIVYSLTELEDIEKVQLLLEGKVRDSIWGYTNTKEPIAR